MPIQLGRQDLLQAYTNLLLRGANLRLESTDAQVAIRAAQLRAKYHLRTPDALHVATALEHSCQAFLTNDRDLLRVGELRVLLLDDLTL